MAKKKAANLPPKLTETEQDLLSHIQNGYQLETDSLGGNPLLRRLKDVERVETVLRFSIPNFSLDGIAPAALVQSYKLPMIPPHCRHLRAGCIGQVLVPIST